MNKSILGLCSRRQLLSYCLAGLIIFGTIHLLKIGLVTMLPITGTHPIQANSIWASVLTSGFQNIFPLKVGTIVQDYTDSSNGLNISDVGTIQPVPWNSSHLPMPSTKNVDMKEYARILHKYASADNWIIMTLIDMGCADMAVNFYVTSLKPFNIQNYVFVGQDHKTCDFVEKYGINCYVYVVDKDASHSSLYHSKDFLRKMNIRTYMILDALNLGYNVLHTDVDITFMKDPTQDFKCEEKCDIAPLWDCGAYNAGFLFIRNTIASRAMYAVSKHIADHEPKTDDQKALNRAIDKAKKTHGLKLLRLPTDKYMCGKAFWEGKPKRNFAEDSACEKCVVVHDNWIVSMEAKRYRLQEMNWWEFDGDHRYYTCPERKYLVFGNPAFYQDNTQTEKLELETLKTAMAIGAVLNRTVVFAQFHCGSNGERKCTLLDHLLVRNFEQQFPDQYRESTFLTNPMVPKTTKDSISRLIFIETTKANIMLKGDNSIAEAAVYRPQDRSKGASVSEIKEWFGNSDDKILKFHSLYGAFCCYDDHPLGQSFQNKLSKAFAMKGTYRQFDK